MSLGWLIMALALGAVGSSSHVIGRPVFWLDDQRWGVTGTVLMTAALALPFGAVLLFAYLEGPYVPHLASLATVEMIVLAIADRHRSPGAATVIGALAAAGLLLSVAAFIVRFRRLPDSTT